MFSLAAEAQVTVAISPTSVSIEVNKTKQFAATVTGTTNTGVKWFVDGIQGGSTDAGTITTGGLYTAPAVTGNHVVSITSNADPTQSASSQVTVTAAAVVTISISPTSVTLNTGATKQFAASVTGTTNTGVKWFVDGIQGGSADAGTITTGGLYTAPSVAGDHVVSITSNADPTKSATSQVTVVVPATITVAISPTSVTLNTSATKQFAATVTGTTNTGVKWFVDGIRGGSADAGTITTSGLYTAPAVAGNHVVSITSNADPTKTASSQVTVAAATISIAISPTSASMTTGGTKQFTATVSGTTGTGVTWFVDNVQGGNSTTGTVSTGGLYTAPTTAGDHVVSVTSNADSTKSASAQVTVTTATTVTIAISPTSATVTTGMTKQFASTVTGTTNTGVKWFVDNVQGGSSTTGTITTGGLYTAPSTTGNHVVSITSNADPTQSASSQVTVTAPTAVSISITPTSATVPGTQTKQYQAIVSGTTNIGVKWYVDNILGGNDTVGNISTSGLYLAPNTPSTHTITVVSNADTTKSATSALTITGTIWVVMRPYTACVPINKTLQYTASVQGTTNQNVNWQVDGTTGGSSRNGTINNSGLYTAPGTAGSHTIRAVSQANTSKVVSTTVTVASTVSVSVSPSPVAVPVGETQQFVARVCGNTNTGVNWFVDNIAGGNATVGTIDSDGNYTAPATEGSHTIKAVSQADTSKSGTATATVVNGITADFGGRTGGKPIPTELFGTQLTNLTDPNGFKLLTDAGLMHTRIYSNIQNVFTTRTPDWTKIDPIIQKLKTAGIRPMLEITYTPPWLVPTTVSGCAPSYRIPPTDYAGYANIAAQFVAHMNQTFPDFIVDYEIWNEPDLSNFCTSPNTDSQRSAVYQKLFAATAKAMHDQAAADGKPIRTGGPTTVTGSTFTWIPALLSNSTTAPYMDFVSYHTYLTGLDSTQAKMAWDGTGGPKTLYAYEQDSGGGFAAWFLRVSTLVRQGSQPNPTTTPIYVSEYNDNWSFTDNCCRNDPTIAPVFNGLAIVDYLGAVYSGAQQVPGKLYYYSASAFPYFCLIGTWDTEMTCTYPPGSVPVPYPQYHPYSLAASPNYLDLASGGNMAISVTPGFAQHGITATAFYTNNKESIFAVNPTSASFANVTFNFNNTGLSSAAGTAYRIDGPNNTIVATPVTLNTTSSGFSATIAVPPYSVVAVSIQ